MKTPLVFAAALVICSAVSAADTPAAAAAPAAAPAPVAPAVPPPTKESIEKLLVVMNVEKLIANMQAQVEGAMKNGIDQSLRGQPLTPEQQQLADALRTKVITSLSDEMSWDKLKPVYLEVYSESFTQEEIDGLTAFYESPAGKAFVSKVPQVMKRTMALMQVRMTPVLRNLQQSIRDSAQQINDMRAKSAAAAAAAAAPAPSAAAAPAEPASAPTAKPASQ